jgi:NADPH2:quinone reductase
MRAVVAVNQQLEVVERPLPEPGPGEVRIAVHAAGVNRPDVLQRKGLYPPPPGVTDVLGLEVAGVVDALGQGATGWRIGDAVCALVAGGGYAEACVVAETQCLPLPQGWSFIEAAGLPETAFTVWSNVFDRGRLQPGEWLLVHGGSSGIGVMAIQMAKAMGAHVLATAGSAEKCRVCETLGAERAIDYQTEDFAAIAQDITGGRGVDVILDMVAGSYLERDIACLADDGRIVIIATLGGSKANIPAMEILRRRLTITGSALRSRPTAFKAAIAAALAQHVWPLLESRAIAPVVDQVFALEHAGLAHARMESGAHIGKIILQVR